MNQDQLNKLHRFLESTHNDEFVKLKNYVVKAYSNLGDLGTPISIELRNKILACLFVLEDFAEKFDNVMSTIEEKQNAINLNSKP